MPFAMTQKSTVTIYHNPRCSKSRQALKLLVDHGANPTVIEYLKQPLNEQVLRDLIKKLGISAIDLVRKNEALYRELGLAQRRSDTKATIMAMAQYPILIERPIVVKGAKARIGRPPEAVLEIL